MKDCRASSNSLFCWVQLVCCFASRTAFSMYAVKPIRLNGPCADQCLIEEVLRVAIGDAVSLELMHSARDHRRRNDRHSPGTSVITASRARTSSERLVSWVESVVMVSGCDACMLRAIIMELRRGETIATGSTTDLVQIRSCGCSNRRLYLRRPWPLQVK